MADILEAQGYGIANSSYNNITITITIDHTNVTMNSLSNVYGSGMTQENHTCDFFSYEVFLTIDVSNLNISISMYEVTGTASYSECATEIMLNDVNTFDMLQNSNKKWDYVRIESATGSSAFTINYIDCVAGIKEDIITDAPTDAPSPAPTDVPTPAPVAIPCPATAGWPSTSGGSYAVANSTCKFGYVGKSSVRYCYDYGTWGTVFGKYY